MQSTENRRSFWSALWAAIVGTLFASSASAASRVQVGQIRGAPLTLAGFDASGNGQSVSVGAGLQLAAGVLSGTQSPARQWDVILTRDGSGNYPLPASSWKGVAVYRNGIRQVPGVQYNLVSAAIVPVPAEWSSDASDLVTCDGYPS